MSFNSKELEEKIKALEKQIKSLQKTKAKEFGLVWDDQKDKVREKVVEDCKKMLPILTGKDNAKYSDIVTDKKNKDHILIEGDNYHVLSILNYTHKGKIDVIYIDPPYNTDKKDFIYNDRFVDKEDAYRHSKWLSFMESRLKLAKDLLSESGVIFISIDDHEQARLKLLCDRTFGEENFIANISVENNPKGRKNSNHISVSSEYCLVYAKDKLNKKSFFKENIPKDKSLLKTDEFGRVYTSGKRVLVGESSNSLVENFSSNKHYSIYVEKNCENLQIKVENKIEDIDNDLILKGYKRYISIKNNKWIENTYSKEEFQRLFDSRSLLFKDQSIYEKDFNEFIRMKSQLTNDKLNNIDLKTETASKILDDLNLDFSNPKNTSYLKTLFTLVEKRNPIVLDFFAGSGTTGQAVLELNKEDEEKKKGSGNRQFILVTNNGDEKSEHKICEDVTYPRLSKVINGYTNKEGESVAGTGGNLKYLKADEKDFVEYTSDNIENLKQKFVQGCTEIICLKENSFRLIDDSYKTEKLKIYHNDKNYVAILFDLFYFDEFLLKIKDLTDKKVHIYIFSYTKNFSKEEFYSVADHITFSVEPIPEKILETYKKIFRI